MTSSIRSSCARVMKRAQHVSISTAAIEALVEELEESEVQEICSRKQIDMSIHFSGDDDLTAQYLLVMDSINFCFWPDPELEYEHLSLGLRDALLADPHLLDAEKLQKVEGADIRRWLKWPRPLPLEGERARLVREIGHGLQLFDGQAKNLILAANKSVEQLISLLTEHFPGFRDSAVYDGEKVFLLKRAQIFAGDVWGCFGGSGLGEFHDIENLTMFPDYRVPQLLLQFNILQYCEDLKNKVNKQEEIVLGSTMEIEIRAGSVIAVEKTKEAFRRRFGDAHTPHSVQLDWWLWETAERQQQEGLNKIGHHHRVLTLQY